jgi:hypothetical protein
VAPSVPRSVAGWLLGLTVMAALPACGGGPGSEEDLVAALTRNEAFTEAQATCIAAAVFAEYGDDEEALGKISGTADFADLTGPEGVDGFEETFEQIVEVCTNTG